MRQIDCRCRTGLASVFFALVGASQADAVQEVLHEKAGKDHWLLGSAVESLEDLDGDGIRDFAVGAPHARDFRGLVKVYSGRTGDGILRIAGPETGPSWFGLSIANAGDVDGDGTSDLIVGDPSDDEPYGNNGSAQVFSGADGSLLWRVIGDASLLSLGASVTGMGDVNGDSIPDFAAGAPQGSFARVYSGADASLLYQVTGQLLDDAFGSAVESLEDLDGDGARELAVGAIRAKASQPGYVRIYSGATGAQLYHINGDHADDSFGASIAALGDIDGDGTADLLVGAPGPSGVANNYARILSGADGSNRGTLIGPARDSRFGASVASAGDVNGDGKEDLLIGEPLAGPGTVNYGRAVLYSGATLEPLYQFRGRNGEFLGQAVASLGDLDGDGLSEIVIGSPYAEPTGVQSQGAYRVHRGNDLYLDISRRVARAGDQLKLRHAEGPAGNPVALFLTSVDGSPSFVTVTGGVFDASGVFTLTAIVPAGLQGRVLGFTGIGLGASGRIDSIEEFVAFD